MSKEAIGKYLVVDEQEKKPGRKTSWWWVENRSNEYLGEIAWYSPWRQYTFSPSGAAIFSSGCLSDIAVFLKKKTQEQRG